MSFEDDVESLLQVGQDSEHPRMFTTNDTEVVVGKSAGINEAAIAYEEIMGETVGTFQREVGAIVNHTNNLTNLDALEKATDLSHLDSLTSISGRSTAEEMVGILAKVEPSCPSPSPPTPFGPPAGIPSSPTPVVPVPRPPSGRLEFLRDLAAQSKAARLRSEARRKAGIKLI